MIIQSAEGLIIDMTSLVLRDLPSLAAVGLRRRVSGLRPWQSSPHNHKDHKEMYIAIEGDITGAIDDAHAAVANLLEQRIARRADGSDHRLGGGSPARS
jgi:hypothetical protein